MIETWTKHRPKPGPSRAQAGPTPGPRQKFETQKIQKIKMLEIKMHVAQNFGKVRISRKNPPGLISCSFSHFFCVGPSPGPSQAAPKPGPKPGPSPGPSRAQAWPKPGPSWAHAGPTPKIWDPKNPKNKNSQNQDSCRPKCRQGQD